MLTYTYQVNAQVIGTPGKNSPIIMDVSNTAKLEGIEKEKTERITGQFTKSQNHLPE